MSREQRKAVDALLRKGSSGFAPQPVEEMRKKFTALMGLFPIPDARTREIQIANRPAVLVESNGENRPGTILYFHGGSFSLAV